MHADLEPIAPTEALELYLNDRSSDLSDWTIRSHRSRLSTFIDWCIEEEGLEDLNELTGRTIHRYKIWRRDEGDINTVTLKTQIDTVRVFIKWLETIEGCPPDLHAKVKSPSLSAGENTRDDELHTEEAEPLLAHLKKYEYASLRHVALTLLWHTMMRRGAARALDVRDYHRDDQYLAVVHRPDSGTPLKNGDGGERMVALSDSVADLLNDWLDEQRPAVTDAYGREPLLATSQGRLHVTTIQQYAYMATRPCAYGAECPHDRNPETCDAAVERYEASKCPSSVSPHAIRRGSITHWLREDVPTPAISDRADVSADVIDVHYDERSAQEKMEQRRSFLDDV
jgi:integrase